MSILNTAASGRFSTDRTMRDYNRDIWRLEPVSRNPIRRRTRHPAMRRACCRASPARRDRV